MASSEMKPFPTDRLPTEIIHLILDHILDDVDFGELSPFETMPPPLPTDAHHVVCHDFTFKLSTYQVTTAGGTTGSDRYHPKPNGCVRTE